MTKELGDTMGIAVVCENEKGEKVEIRTEERYSWAFSFLSGELHIHTCIHSEDGQRFIPVLSPETKEKIRTTVMGHPMTQIFWHVDGRFTYRHADDGGPFIEIRPA